MIPIKVGGIWLGFVLGCVMLLIFLNLASATELKSVVDRGYLSIAVKDNVKPLGFRGDDGKLRGLEIELARQLALGLLGSPDSLRLVPVKNQDRLSWVVEGKVDLAIARITCTKQRSRLVWMSDPYYGDGTMLVSNKVRSLKELGGGKVAVLNNSTTISVLEDRLPLVRLVGVDSYQAAFNLLVNNQVMAFAADGSLLSGWVLDHPKYRLLGPKLSVDPLCIAIRKGMKSKMLFDNVNELINNLIRSGWLAGRIKYWRLP